MEITLGHTYRWHATFPIDIRLIRLSIPLVVHRHLTIQLQYYVLYTW